MSEGSRQVNVFVADDAPEVRKRLVALVRTIRGAEVLGESDSVRGAIDGALNPDVDTLLLDLQLLDGTGLDVLAAIKPQRPELRVIVLSNFTSSQHCKASLAAGADVFLDKSCEFKRIPQILRDWLSTPASDSDLAGTTATIQQLKENHVRLRLG